MAEQAINTIYALGERPDQLCDTIIKNFTRKVFGQAPQPAPAQSQPQVRPPLDISMDDTVGDQSIDLSAVGPADVTVSSTGVAANSTDQIDSFVLSQLLFIAGHVAIKQIVFLELVEREWKRQKETVPAVKGT